MTVNTSNLVFGTSPSKGEIDQAATSIQKYLKQQALSADEQTQLTAKIVFLLRAHSQTTTGEITYFKSLIQGEEQAMVTIRQAIEVAQSLGGVESTEHPGLPALSVLVRVLLINKLLYALLEAAGSQQYYQQENPLFSPALMELFKGFNLPVQVQMKQTELQSLYKGLKKATNTLPQNVTEITAIIISQFSPLSESRNGNDLLDFLNEIIQFVESYPRSKLIAYTTPYHLPWAFSESEYNMLVTPVKELKGILNGADEFGFIQTIVNALRHIIINQCLMRVVAGALTGFICMKRIPVLPRLDKQQIASLAVLEDIQLKIENVHTLAPVVAPLTRKCVRYLFESQRLQFIVLLQNCIQRYLASSLIDRLYGVLSCLEYLFSSPESHISFLELMQQLQKGRLHTLPMALTDAPVLLKTLKQLEDKVAVDIKPETLQILLGSQKIFVRGALLFYFETCADLSNSKATKLVQKLKELLEFDSVYMRNLFCTGYLDQEVSKGMFVKDAFLLQPVVPCQSSRLDAVVKQFNVVKNVDQLEQVLLKECLVYAVSEYEDGVKIVKQLAKEEQELEYIKISSFDIKTPVQLVDKVLKNGKQKIFLSTLARNFKFLLLHFQVNSELIALLRSPVCIAEQGSSLDEGGATE